LTEIWIRQTFRLALNRLPGPDVRQSAISDFSRLIYYHSCDIYKLGQIFEIIFQVV